MTTQAEQYARRLQRDYFIEQTPVNLPDDEYITVDQVAQAVLPPALYIQWRRDFTAEINQLRAKFGMEPISD